MTIIAMILRLCHSLLTVAARVNKINIKNIAVKRSNNLITLSLYHRVLRTDKGFCSLKGECERISSLAALRRFKNSVNANDINVTDSMIVQML